MRNLENGPQPVEPSWMPGLREKLQRAMQRYQEVFIALTAAPQS